MSSSTSDEAVTLVGGAPSTLAQMGVVVRRWRARRAELARLFEEQATLRAAQRTDDAAIRAFMERHERAELPTSAPGPDGRPRRTGTIWLSAPRSAPRPITKTHLSEVLESYGRLDEVARAHLAAYIWEHREFGPEEVKVNFDAEECDDDNDAAAATTTEGRKRRRRGAAGGGEGGSDE